MNHMLAPMMKDLLAPELLTPGLPPSLDGLVVDLDASVLSSITELAGAVSQIDDLSGNGNHGTQPSGALQPITGTQTIGGLNGLNFIPNNQLIVPNNANDDMDIFMVVHVRTGGGGHNQWWGNEGLYDAEQAGGTQDFGSSIQTTGLLGFGFGPGPAGGDSTAKTPGSVLGADILINMTRGVAPDLRQIRLDGALVVNLTTGGRTDTRNAIRRTIGSIQTNGNYLDFIFGQLLVYNRIRTATERADINQYLRAKWGTP